MKREYDLVIIGRGAAAFSAAIKASEITSGQASIAMVGFGHLGGTCVNVGCVPSKYLIEASKMLFDQRNPRYPGIAPVAAEPNLKDLMGSLRDAVEGEREAKYEDVIRQYDNIDIVEGKATFKDGNEISVSGNAHNIRGYNFIIATGSSTTVPDIEGLGEAAYLTSDNIWDLDDVPGRLAVVGGGAIGLELGQAFSRLGSEVHVVEALPSILPQAEPEISTRLMESLAKEGIEFIMKARVLRVSTGKVIDIVTAEGRKELKVDAILMATGRAPNVSGLNLEAAGVKYSRKGISVDSNMRTSNPRIYAAGDVVDQRLMLETLAAREGVIAATNIYEHANQSVNMMAVPWAVFTEPQLASVGFTEKEFTNANGGCSCRSLDLKSVPKARILREEDGLFKIVVDPRNDRIVGVHALSPYAAELIMEGVCAIQHGLTINDVLMSSHVFPTVSEGIKLTAQSFIRDISKMSCCME